MHHRALTAIVAAFARYQRMFREKEMWIAAPSLVIRMHNEELRGACVRLIEWRVRVRNSRNGVAASRRAQGRLRRAVFVQAARPTKKRERMREEVDEFDEDAQDRKARTSWAAGEYVSDDDE